MLYLIHARAYGRDEATPTRPWDEMPTTAPANLAEAERGESYSGGGGSRVGSGRVVGSGGDGLCPPSADGCSPLDE